MEVFGNVLIYFNRDLQDRALKLFSDSLVTNGSLCLGSRETVSLSRYAGDFDIEDRTERLYRKAN